MPVSKIKNIIIVALALVNLIFIAVLISDSIADRSERREALRSLSSIMSDNGVALDIDGISEDQELPALSAKPGEDIRSRIASAILGDTECSDQGGGVYLYSGAGGQAVFRSGGEFELTLSAAEFDISGSAEKTVGRILKKTNINAEIISAEEDGGTQTVTAVCVYNGIQIFNCRMEFVFTGGSLAGISGRLSMDINEKTEKTVTISSATALMKFLELIRRGRVECTEIYNVSAGYLMSVTPLGDCEFNSAWLIGADLGNYYIDAETGRLLTGVE